jgi:hypothetical protein
VITLTATTYNRAGAALEYNIEFEDYSKLVEWMRVSLITQAIDEIHIVLNERVAAPCMPPTGSGAERCDCQAGRAEVVIIPVVGILDAKSRIRDERFDR